MIAPQTIPVHTGADIMAERMGSKALASRNSIYSSSSRGINQLQLQ
jgi:hypothetical protein